MPRSRTLQFLLFAFAPALALAQPGLPLDTTANDSLQAFEARMLAQPIREQEAAPLTEYKLVWKEHNNGYFTITLPVDTATTLFSSWVPGRHISLDPTVDGPTYYGERYAVLVAERPVDMLDLTRWYFERR